MKITITQILTFALFLFLPFFSKASDSLKVKKIEYFDNGILVRTTIFDAFGGKTKDFFYNYQDIYNRYLSN